MKRYDTLVDLLTDFRKINNISRNEFAAMMDVDLRSVYRWEANEYLLKPEKERLFFEVSLVPFQVIRNLNSFTPIPTYYDFNLRKYSLTEYSFELPDPIWFKDRLDFENDKIRTITSDDLGIIYRILKKRKVYDDVIGFNLIEKAIKLLPELNIVITDNAGYYSGHCITLPISAPVYQKIKDKTLGIGEIEPDMLVNYKDEKKPVFLFYDVTADNNDNVFYLISHLMRFFRSNDIEDYIAASYTTRYDSEKFNEQLGLNIVWDCSKTTSLPGLPRLADGDFKKFLRI